MIRGLYHILLAPRITPMTVRVMQANSPITKARSRLSKRQIEKAVRPHSRLPRERMESDSNAKAEIIQVMSIMKLLSDPQTTELLKVLVNKVWYWKDEKQIGRFSPFQFKNSWSNQSLAQKYLHKQPNAANTGNLQENRTLLRRKCTKHFFC